MISPWTSRFILIVFWAMIYLPGLGDLEIKGEEWRRTLPGRTMLQNGDWLVPRSGGMPYVRKPPLINWVSAASFKMTGVVNEWSARLPSVLMVLGGALGMFALCRRWMGDTAALVGGLFILASIGMIEKGRLAEIEVYYIVLPGCAFAAWLGGFTGKMNRWAAWLLTGLFLGLAMLAKGPAHLLFFYLPLVGVCWSTRRWREIFSLPHLAGLAVFFGVTLAWALPFMDSYARLMGIEPRDVLQAWSDQVSSRVTVEEETNPSDWLVRGPKSLVMFLPWVLLLPLWWQRARLAAAFPEPEERRIFDGLKWGVVAGFAAMVMIPGSSARYVAPLLAPVLLMTAWMVVRLPASATTLTRKIWHGMNRFLFALGVIALGGAAIAYWPASLASVAAWTTGVTLATWLVLRVVRQQGTLAIVPLTLVSLLATTVLVGAFSRIGHSIMSINEDVRPTALAIRKALGNEDEGPLLVFHLGQMPYPFYFPDSSFEAARFEQVPADGNFRWMLTSPKTDAAFRPWFERRFGKGELVAEFPRTWGNQGDRGDQMVLIKFAGKPPR